MENGMNNSYLRIRHSVAPRTGYHIITCSLYIELLLKTMSLLEIALSESNFYLVVRHSGDSVYVYSYVVCVLLYACLLLMEFMT